MAAAPRRDVHVTQWVARPALGSRHEEMGLLGVAKVVLRILLVLGATASALVAACLIKCLVFPIDKVIGRAWLDRYVVAAWADAVIGGPILPRGPALKLSGELPAPERRAGILIANHQLDTDWFYLWDVCRVVGAHGDVLMFALSSAASLSPSVQAFREDLSALNNMMSIYMLPSDLRYRLREFLFEQASHPANEPPPM